MSEMCKSDFGHFSAFFELWTVFWAVFRYPSGKLKTYNPNIDIWVPKLRFSKMYGLDKRLGWIKITCLVNDQSDSLGVPVFTGKVIQKLLNNLRAIFNEIVCPCTGHKMVTTGANLQYFIPIVIFQHDSK